MKKYFTCLLLITSIIGHTQITDEQKITDSSFGWMSIYHYKGVKTSRTLNDKVFSPAQLSLCDSFSNWIQASYIPKGCIGDVRRMIGPGENIYNPTIKYQPQIYGATSYTWTLSMENGKPKPIQETEIPWGITANEIPGNLLKPISTGGDIYFFMEEAKVFEPGTPQKIVDQYNIKTLPQFKNYHTLHSTASRYDRNAGFVESVLLCKDNKLPFITVTVEDLISRCEMMINQSHEAALESIKEKNKGDQKSIDYFSNYENDNYKRALKNFAIFKDRYKSMGNQPAMLPSGFDYVDFYNGQDIFTRIKLDEKPISAPRDRYPVYKLSPGTKELSRQDKPLWIRVTWNWDIQDERMKHMHESIISNFNFDYLYNFIFYPEKVKGLAYKPLHDPSVKKAVQAAAISDNTKKAAADPAVFFFEDFSGTPEGQPPVNWFTRINSNGQKAKVTSVPGLDGKWLEIKGQTGLLPNLLKKPLPENFEISFDLAVPKDITWGTKSFEMYLGADDHYTINGKSVNIRLRAGFSGRDGEMYVEPNFGDGLFDGKKSYYEIPGFSNDKPVNKIAIRIRKKGTSFEIAGNGMPLAAFDKAFPDKTLFRWLQISQANSDTENQKYYFSNFKVVRF